MSTANVPRHVPAECVVDVDVYAMPGAEVDFYGAWKRLQRSAGPAFLWTPRNGGHWIATRGRDIAEILGDPSRFSSAGALIPKPEGETKLFALQLDPPQHTPFKRAFAQGVAHAMPQLQARAAQLVGDILDPLVARGKCEFLSEVAEALPLAFFRCLTGLPPADQHTLRQLAGRISGQNDEMSSEELAELVDDYLRPIVAERLRAPADDALSRMFAEPIQGSAMELADAMTIARDLIFAGLDTVSSNLGFLALPLAPHPAHCRQLLADPALVPTAIDELLRRYVTLLAGREVVSDLRMSGVQLKRADIVCLPSTLYNLDETLFEDPMQVKLDRRNNGHRAFGGGPHRCPGAAMARLELVTFVREWLRRIPSFALDPRRPVTMKSGSVVAALQHLDLHWPVTA